MKEIGIGLIIPVVLGFAACVPMSTPHSSPGTQATPTMSFSSVPSPTNLPESKAVNEEKISVIVALDFVPLARYEGGIAGLEATAPSATGANRLDMQSQASQAYLAYIESEISDFEQVLSKTIPAAMVVQRYMITYAGVSVILPAQEVERLRQLPGVVSVREDEVLYSDTDNKALQEQVPIKQD